MDSYRGRVSEGREQVDIGSTGLTESQETNTRANERDEHQQRKDKDDLWLAKEIAWLGRPLPPIPPAKDEPPLPPLPQPEPLGVPHTTSRYTSSTDLQSQYSQRSYRSQSTGSGMQPPSNHPGGERNTWLRSQSTLLQRHAYGWSSGSLLSGGSGEMPETMEQVNALCDQVRSTGDVRTQVSLCKWLMEVAAHRLGTTSLPEEVLTMTARGMKRTLTELMVLEARRILKRLATTGQALGQCGDSEAQCLLADCYGMGALGLRVDHERAFRWYIQASKQNHAEATYRAAVCHELGIGTSIDGNRAVVFYRKGANLSHVPSMYKLSVILLRGYCQQIPMRREGISWLQRAAAATLAAAKSETGLDKQQVVPDALHTLAVIQLTGELAGESTSLIADPVYALELLHEAAQLGYRPSQLKLGGLYEHDKFVDMDEAKSIYWYTRACSPRTHSGLPPSFLSPSPQGSVEGALALSAWYLTGSTGLLQQSDREAYLWARKAASLARKGLQRTKQGIPAGEDDEAYDETAAAKAYYTVATYLERGIGVTGPRMNECAKWYQAAAALGHQGALQRLEQCAEP